MNTVHDPLVQAMYGFPGSYTMDLIVSHAQCSLKHFEATYSMEGVHHEQLTKCLIVSILQLLAIIV